MNTTISNTAAHQAASPAYQAFRILHVGFVVAPILAGLDKFFHLLVNWDQYMPSIVARMSPIDAHNLMLVVGVIEIVAGIGVAFKPRIFAYVVAGWLAVIIVICCSFLAISMSRCATSVCSSPPWRWLGLASNSPARDLPHARTRRTKITRDNKT